MSGRTGIVRQAIKIILARDKSRFKDGVFMVDLENVSDNAVIEKITSSINLINPLLYPIAIKLSDVLFEITFIVSIIFSLIDFNIKLIYSSTFFSNKL